MSNQLLLRRRNAIVNKSRPNYLKMTALEDATDISIVATGTPYPVMLQYSLNGGTFINYTISDTITINTGETIEWRRSPNDTDNKFSKNDNNYYDFSISKSVKTTGLITTLLTTDGLVTTIPAYSFSQCKSLEWAFEFPDNITFIGEKAFANCRKFYGNLIVPDSLTSCGNRCFSSLFGIKGTITIPLTFTTLSEGMFSDCWEFVGPLVIPEGVTNIPNNCFYNCKACKDITIPSTVTSMGLYAFSGVRDAIVKCLPTSVPSINASFWSMAGLKVYVPYSADHSILTAYQTAWGGINIFELDENGEIPS